LYLNIKKSLEAKMFIYKNKNYFTMIIVTALFVCLGSMPAFAKIVTQLTPTMTITEEYSDNYFKTQGNKTDEYITNYELGFSLGLLEKNHKVYLNYTPVYKDYEKLDQNDGLDHIISLDGITKPSKLSNLFYGFKYEKTDTDRIGESASSNAFASGDIQVGKNTNLNFSQDYSQNFNQQALTGVWNNSDTNKSSVGMNHQFGEKDRIGLNYDYSFTEYENPNSDDFTSHKPSTFLGFWFTPLFGSETNLSYEKVEYDLSNDEKKTYSGDFRLIRKITKHFDIYIKYAQTDSERSSGDHQTYHPSAGFDWNPTEDSGISFGGGVIFQEYENQDNYNKEKLFFDIDMYKIFNFSRRGSLSVTGSSGYGELDSDAASLGFNIHYQAGLNFTYQLTRRLSTDIVGSYKINEYDEPANSRKDNTLNFRTGLSWMPLKWLRFNLSYEFEDFGTDSNQRGDYQENKGTISVSFIPSTPIRLKSIPSRKALEEKIFN